ncbi:unnamed protein product [Cutaneotrichosporon oleaginosum]
MDVDEWASRGASTFHGLLRKLFTDRIRSGWAVQGVWMAFLSTWERASQNVAQNYQSPSSLCAGRLSMQNSKQMPRSINRTAPENACAGPPPARRDPPTHFYRDATQCPPACISVERISQSPPTRARSTGHIHLHLPEE